MWRREQAYLAGCASRPARDIEARLVRRCSACGSHRTRTTAGCARRSPRRSPGDAGSIPATSTSASAPGWSVVGGDLSPLEADAFVLAEVRARTAELVGWRLDDLDPQVGGQGLECLTAGHDRGDLLADGADPFVVRLSRGFPDFLNLLDGGQLRPVGDVLHQVAGPLAGPARAQKEDQRDDRPTDRPHAPVAYGLEPNPTDPRLRTPWKAAARLMGLALTGRAFLQL